MLVEVVLRAGATGVELQSEQQLGTCRIEIHGQSDLTAENNKFNKTSHLQFANK